MRRGLRATSASLAVAVALVTASCGNATGSSAASPSSTAPGGSTGSTAAAGTYPAVTAPGVTATEIKVGGVAAVTNPLGGSYGGAFDGVQAYFDMINASGGVYGRKLVLDQRQDDQFTNNKSKVDALISSDIFAVLPVATLAFSGAADLVKAGIPTFGWNVNPEWGGSASDPRNNLFGETGSYLGFTDPKPNIPYLAKALGLHKLGVLAYNVPQSAQCAEGIKNSFDTYGAAADAKIVYLNETLSYGDKDLSVEVSKMKDAGVDLVDTCMDTNGVVTLATEMDKQGLTAKQYLPNGYDHDFLKQYGDLFDGSIVRTDYAAMELPAAQRPAGLKNYLSWLGKLDKPVSDNSAAGWLNANLFVDGLKAAGPNFSRQGLIDAINKMTVWNANGMASAVDWTKQHSGGSGIYCDFVMVIQKGAFVTKFSKPGKPFLCVNADPKNLTATNQA